VSYSCYDSLGWGGKTELKTGKDQRDHLKKALDTIESKLKPKEGIQGKRVFIGEFAFRRNLLKSPYLNDAYCRNVFQAAIEWGCPFVLYWEMYNNEIDEDGNHRGYWLIDNHGVKTQLYYTVLEYDAENLKALNFLAWIQATSRDGQLRKPTEALQLAQRAATAAEYKTAEVMDTLAVAYAATGDFAQAVTEANKAIALAESSGDTALAQRIAR
jgi:hypothetical protein